MKSFPLLRQLVRVASAALFVGALSTDALAQPSPGTGPTTVQRGGTGRATLTNHGVLLGAGVGAINATSAGSAGQLLIGQGGSSDPSFVAVTGDVTINSSGVTAIGANKVTDAMIRQSAGLSLVGRSANSTGNVADITCGTDGNAFRRSGTAVGCGALDLSAAGTVGSSILAGGNGGTGNAFFAVAGPATSTKTYTFPNASSTIVTTDATQTLTGKTITGASISSSAISSGSSATGLTSLGVLSSGTGSFDLRVANSENLTAARTLTITTGDANRTLSLAGNLTTAGAFTTAGGAITLTVGGSTNVTLPTTGTLATLAGSETLTNKTISGASNTLTVRLASDVTGDLPLTNIAQIATDRLLGRDTASTGDIEELTVGGGLEFSGSGGIQRSALTGDVTASAASNATTIASNAVSDAKLRDSAALSVIGRSANSSGDPADIAAANDGEILRRSGTAIGFGTIATAGIADDQVTNAKAANMAQATIKGRASGAGTGDPTDLTGTQATVILDAMVGDSGAGGTKGLVPAPGAGDASAAKFLKADGTWAVPAGGGGGGALTDAERRNMLLTCAGQAKALVGYQRQIETFCDGYKAIDGILAASSSNYSADTTNGRVAPDTGGTTVTINSADSTVVLGGFTVIDRGTAVTNSLVVNKIGVYSLVAGTFVAKIVKRNSANNYDVVVSQSFSHTGAGWQDVTLSANYTVPGTGTFYVATYTAAGGSLNIKASTSRAYVAADITGAGQGTSAEDTGQAFPLRYTHTPTSNNMTLVTTAQDPDGTASAGRVLLEVEPVDSITLNTDLTVEVSCNGGTNWATGTLSSAGAGQSGHSIVETASTSCGANTGSTDVRARIKSLNNKSLRIYRTAFVWS